MIKNNSGLKIDRRLTVQMVFLGLAMLATMADFAYIHYVCPVCGVITAQQFLVSDIPLYLKLHNPAAVIIGGMLLIAVLFGPVFCGWVCPFGGYQDLISKIANKVMPSRKKIRVAPKLDQALRYLRYGVLGFVIYMTARGSVAVLESNNPYHALLNLVKGEFAVGGLIFLGVITLMAWFIDRPWCKYLCPYGSVLGLSNGIKLFKVVRNSETCVSCKKCNKACPMNLDVASSKAVTNHQCISCFACTDKKVCPVNKTLGVAIQPYGEKGEESMKSKVKIGIASSLILALAGAGYAATGVKEPVSGNGVASSTTGSNAAQVKTEHDSLNRTSAATAKAIQGQTGKYKDGVYTAVGAGYQPGLKVQVTVKNKKITDVSVVQHNETPGFYERAFRLVPSEIVMAQSTKVDTVSGATYSSKGIINAVNKALANAIDPNAVVTTSVSNAAGTTNANGAIGTSHAVGSNGTATQDKSVLSSKSTKVTLPQNKSTHGSTPQPALKERNHKGDGDQENRDWESSGDDFDNGGQTTSVAPQELQTPAASVSSSKVSGLYKNGTYYGVGNGYQPDLQVQVVVSNNKISDIQLVSSQETPRFLNRAWSKVTGGITSQQSTQVDTVSGATYSSLGIMEAVKNALAHAKL